MPGTPQPLFTAIRPERSTLPNRSIWRKRTAQLADAFEISCQIIGILDLDELLREACQLVQQLFSCEYVDLLLPAGEALIRRSFVGKIDPQAHPHELFEPDKLAAQAFQQSRIQHKRAGGDLAPPAWVVAAPLLIEAGRLGVVECWRPGAQAWSDFDLDLLGALTRQIAQAIVNARRYAEAQRHARDLELLDQIRSSLAAQPSLPDLLHNVVEQVAGALDYPRVSLYMLRGEQLQLLHQVGYARLSASLSLAKGIQAEVVRTGRPALLHANTQPLGELGQQPSTISTLSIPLRASRVVCGVLTVESARGRVLDEGDQQLLSALADQVADTIEFSQLYATLEARVTQLALVDDISRNVTASLDQNAALEATVTQVPRAVPCQRLSLSTYQPNGHTFTVRALWLAGGASGIGVGAKVDIGDSEAGVALRTSRLHYVEDLAESRYTLSQQLLEEGLRSVVHVPIMAPEGCLGMLNLSRSEPHAFSAYDRSLLGSLAPHIATAFKNAELYTQAQQAYAELAAAQERNVQIEKLRALGELASGVAHDFNNLLTIILGHMELMKTPDSPNFNSSRQVIIQAAQDGAHTVRRIREFVRAKPEPHTMLVDLAELGENVLQFTQPRWNTALLNIGTTITAQTALHKLPLVLGSAAELREVVTNLILNAVDAMPEGGTLSLRTGATGEQVWLEVADTGQGIAPQVLERIFEPFYTTKVQRGTGLGLAVSRSIARRHAGDLTVESALGGGSRFRLSLPVAPSDANPPSVKLVVQDTPLAPLRILLVEDDVAVRETLARLFALDGHTITAASGGAQALELFSPGAYDVVCSDLSMPGMSGWDLLAQLREREPSLVTVLLSGWGAQISGEEARAKNVDFIVPKPIDMDALNTALAEAAKRKPAPNLSK